MKEQQLSIVSRIQQTASEKSALLTRLKLVNTDPLASVCGMAGAFVLASPGGYSRWGWVFFLLSNAFWIWSGIKVKNKSLLLQYLFFTGTAIYGIHNTFLL